MQVPFLLVLAVIVFIVGFIVHSLGGSALTVVLVAIIAALVTGIIGFLSTLSAWRR